MVSSAKLNTRPNPEFSSYPVLLEGKFRSRVCISSQIGVDHYQFLRGSDTKGIVVVGRKASERYAISSTIDIPRVIKSRTASRTSDNSHRLQTYDFDFCKRFSKTLIFTLASPIVRNFLDLEGQEDAIDVNRDLFLLATVLQSLSSSDSPYPLQSKKDSRRKHIVPTTRCMIGTQY
ncbi:hypothetical protein BT96DRAFT_939415 [Gymnopus androsaceus JB14]|uniref:Uncharacterized protein n=1 Tax=Gymnopus androsaceus JB14 TaxID=1447944 RepID=A0A6A4HP27_9AGAR|nr:hypothetical protein BT96DRAFT_939415 [Gymnopus androsaceus JB14]